MNLQCAGERNNMVFIRDHNVFNVFSRLSTSFLIELVLASMVCLVQITMLCSICIVILLYLKQYFFCIFLCLRLCSFFDILFIAF